MYREKKKGTIAILRQSLTSVFLIQLGAVSVLHQ